LQQLNKCRFSLVLKLTGIIYEDSLIQVGYKLESKANLARMALFFGNKSKESFSDFHTLVSCPDTLSTHLLTQVIKSYIMLCIFVFQVKPVDPVIAAGAQIQQVVHFICVQDFYSMPVAKIAFNYM
jgi:AP-2 complex subunit alpha